jgi:hypothetical protein
MAQARRYERVSVYLDTSDLRERIKVAAARRGVSVSDYCLAAVRRRLAQDGLLPPSQRTARSASASLDKLRERIGPVGVPVRDFVDEARQR